MIWFNIHQGEDYPEYTINLSQICGIDRSDDESWEVCMSNGETYTLEGDDLARFRQATGL